uniref:Ribosome-associated translation inhibitor RaiA n=1 Tax=candidate division WWE3 bacterium TaxID=2053526 RepID=A0A7C4XHW4_UNCKA
MINLQITSDNIEVTQSMKALAESKLEKVVQRLKDVPEDLISIRVVLNKGEAEETFESKVEITVGGKVYFANNSAFSMESALVDAIEDILRQYNKVKSKNESENWQKGRELKVYSDAE